MKNLAQNKRFHYVIHMMGNSEKMDQWTESWINNKEKEFVAYTQLTQVCWIIASNNNTPLHEKF